MGFIRWTCYILAAMASMAAVVAGGVLTILVGLFTGLLAFGGFIVTGIVMLAIAIKEMWETPK